MRPARITPLATMNIHVGDRCPSCGDGQIIRANASKSLGCGARCGWEVNALPARGYGIVVDPRVPAACSAGHKASWVVLTEKNRGPYQVILCIHNHVDPRPGTHAAEMCGRRITFNHRPGLGWQTKDRPKAENNRTKGAILQAVRAQGRATARTIMDTTGLSAGQVSGGLRRLARQVDDDKGPAKWLIFADVPKQPQGTTRVYMVTERGLAWLEWWTAQEPPAVPGQRAAP